MSLDQHEDVTAKMDPPVDTPMRRSYKTRNWQERLWPGGESQDGKKLITYNLPLTPYIHMYVHVLVTM
jgi:hypothetical protein